MQTIGKVFISHSSADKDFVDRLVADLVKRSIPVWYDKMDIAIGDSIPGRVNEGLADCRHFLIVMSPSSMNSKWVQEELNAGLVRQIANSGSFIVPLMIKSCDVPPLLAHRRYADFTESYEDGLRDLLAVWGKDIEACEAVGKDSVFPWPDGANVGENFFYLHSERFDRFFRVACSLSSTCGVILDHLIESRSLPYRSEQPDLGFIWHFSYRLVFDGKSIPLSDTLEKAGVAQGSILKLSINGRFEDVHRKELNSMWDGSKMYEMGGAMQKERQLRDAIAARGPLTRENLRGFANRCFAHV